MSDDKYLVELDRLSLTGMNLMRDVDMATEAGNEAEAWSAHQKLEHLILSRRIFAETYRNGHVEMTDFDISNSIERVEEVESPLMTHAIKRLVH